MLFLDIAVAPANFSCIDKCSIPFTTRISLWRPKKRLMLGLIKYDKNPAGALEGMDFKGFFRRNSTNVDGRAF